MTQRNQNADGVGPALRLTQPTRDAAPMLMVPSLVGEQTGCHFAGRCSYVIDACRVAGIPLEHARGEGQLVRCIRHAEIAEPALAGWAEHQR